MGVGLPVASWTLDFRGRWPDPLYGRSDPSSVVSSILLMIQLKTVVQTIEINFPSMLIQLC